MERMTNSADARRAADYLSRYCNKTEQTFARDALPVRIAGFAFYAKVHLIIGSYPQSGLHRTSHLQRP